MKIKKIAILSGILTIAPLSLLLCNATTIDKNDDIL